MTTTITAAGSNPRARSTASHTAPRAFNLSKWFAAVGLLSITLISVTCAVLLSRMTRDHLLQQEALLTRQFMESLISVERAFAYFDPKDDASKAADKVPQLLEHMAAFPDVLRVNVYTSQHEVRWSSDRRLVGRVFPDNPELDEALEGEVEVEMGSVGGSSHDKSEHEHLVQPNAYFVEIYLPIWDEAHHRVLGVIELYRAPRRLFEAIQAGQRVVWLGAVCAGALLYLALFSLVKRADRLIQAQQAQLLEAEKLGVVTDMGSAVAHGIRNPIASIRSSAELMSVGDAQTTSEAASDIISQVDRIEQWIRELLTYAGPVSEKMEPILMQNVLAENLRLFERDLERRGLSAKSTLPDDLPAVRGDPLLFGQVIHGLIANAVDATARGGTITASGERLPGERKVALRIVDTGAGMSPEQLASIFKPFHTTKPNGLGLGLPLAKRIVERYGGSIVITSTPGTGTQVEIVLPVA